MAKIAIYMPDFTSGGVQRQHLRLAPELVAGGHTLTFVVHEPKGALVEKVPPELPIVSLGAKRAVSALRPLTRYLKAKRPDIVVANMGHPNLIALGANRLAGGVSKIIATQHSHLSNQSAGEPNWQHKILPFLYRRFLRHADAIVAVSGGVADDLADVTGVPRAQIDVIYNPAVPDELAEMAAQPADHPWIGGDRPVVVAIGRLVPMKDYPTLLEAMTDVPEARLIVLGEGSIEGALNEKAQSLGIADRVDFAGFQANPYAFLSRASAFVLSSHYEGFGNVIAEALACGTPVVTTDCPGGPAEIVANGAYGRLVPVGDANAIAAALRATLAETPDRARLQTRGQVFTVAAAARGYLDLFDRLLAR